MAFIPSLLLLLSVAHANKCLVQNQSSTGVFENLSHAVRLTAATSFECVEQEIVDIVLDPYRAQSFAVQMCEKESECLNFLKKEAARVSKKSEADFANMRGPLLWSEILKHSAVNRIRPPELSDLPLKDNPEVLFEKIKSAQMAERNLNSNQAVAISCAVLAAMIGPGKFKALGGISQAAKLTKITQRSHDVEKLISKNRLPKNVEKKFLEWEKAISEKGLVEVKKMPGYHDEPLASIKGRHSVRMSDGYRACYETLIKDGVEIVNIITISSDHKHYCR